MQVGSSLTGSQRLMEEERPGKGCPCPWPSGKSTPSTDVPCHPPGRARVAHGDGSQTLTRGVSGIRVAPATPKSHRVVPHGQRHLLPGQSRGRPRGSRDALGWQRDLPQLMGQRGVVNGSRRPSGFGVAVSGWKEKTAVKPRCLRGLQGSAGKQEEGEGAAGHDPPLASPEEVLCAVLLRETL